MNKTNKIQLGVATSEYLSKFFNTKIEYILIEDEDLELQQRIVEFIRDLIAERTWTTVKCPYIYDNKEGILEIFSRRDKCEKGFYEAWNKKLKK